MTRAAVEHIHLSPSQGLPMVAARAAEVVAGVGLRGDRYAAGLGFWRDARVSRAVTLIESEAVERLAADLRIDIQPGELRRNVTTRGIALDDLVGRCFWIGEALFRGTSLCEPCRHLEQLVGRPILKPLVHRAGLRADALTSGRITVGDAIELAHGAARGRATRTR